MGNVKRKSGQTAVEYIIVFAMLLIACSAAAVFLYAARQSGNRAAALTGSEYP